MPDTFQCTLVTPLEQVLDEQVSYASIPAWDGLIGFAPSRAPILLKLGDGVLRLDTSAGGSRFFFVGGGFAQMKDNRLSVIAQEAVPAEQIVPAQVEKNLQEAQAMPTHTADEVEGKQRKIRRAQTLLTLQKEHGKR